MASTAQSSDALAEPAPPDSLQPDQQAADPNGAASAADKEWFRRKNHGGTGA